VNNSKWFLSLYVVVFIIEKEYALSAVSGSYLEKKQPKFYHIDTWRLYESTELEALRFVEQVAEGNVFSVEWADKVLPLLERVSEDAVIVWVKIEHGKSENERKIVVSDYVV
jgi:tRNA A37 threonylcarbamoyladenosine biosynthesis protein TsaE